MKCIADGNPTPTITWSKLNSSLPTERHTVEPSGALILRDVRRGDAGVLRCSADSLLGNANASAKLVVQCKLTFEQFLTAAISFTAIVGNPFCKPVVLIRRFILSLYLYQTFQKRIINFKPFFL